MSKQQIYLDCIDSVPVVTISGECDAFSAKFTHAAVNALIDEGYARIIIDIEKLDFLDVAGFHALEDCCRRLTETNGQMLLVRPEKQVKEVYAILHEQGGCEIVETMDEAFEKFGIAAD